MLVLSKIVATTGDLRAPVNPKYRFDERMHDLVQCLQLDGYVIQDKRILQTDPSITDAAPMEDDLVDSLRSSKAPRANEIVAKILASPDAFRASPPDYNASLVNARIALETMAGDVAAKTPGADTFNPAKWGEVLAFLRGRGEITPEVRSPRKRNEGSRGYSAF